MTSIELSGCVITDPSDHVLLLHRRDHNQWQLPGGRVREDAQEEVNLTVQALRYLGAASFSQGEVDYSCKWFQATKYEGSMVLTDWATYDDFGFYNLYRRGVGRLCLSPNVEKLVHGLQNEDILLQAKNPVQ